ncbi:MAG: cohesin domain-containing protein [Ruminococcus sp.]|nr:cohesin domain-containing protein [Ruminococcus sp.]
MKSLHARIAAILLVAAMGVTLSACSKDDADISSASGENSEVSDNGENNTAENSTAANNNGDNSSREKSTNAAIEDSTDFLKQEITFGMDPSKPSGNVQDPTEAPNAQTNAPQTVVYTKKVIVTEAGGAAVTDAKGQDVTEVVTEVQTETNPYVAVPVSESIYWLDMTGNCDKLFEGDMMELEFRIKEGTPDGNYPIILSSPDFVNWDEEQLDVKTVAGYVTVGNATPTQQAQVQPGQFTISSSCASGKVGDTITVTINIHSNPGLVGMLFKVEFDSGALEYIESNPGSAMENITKKPTVN